MKELFKGFGIIDSEDVLLLNDLKTPESDVQTSVLETASKKYINAIVKYYNVNHANVIFIKNNYNEKILIDDANIRDGDLDENGFQLSHVIAGIFVAHTEIKKSIYGHGEIVGSTRYIPTVLFFNGGAILSILFIICIVAVVVCVVIYIHDHYWFKPQAQPKAIPKI